jgi:TPP-dependent pyruvate/acetoin dehydrogenase alpha subunit
MQIPASTSYFGPTAAKATSNAGTASAATSTSATSPAMDKLKSKGNDVVQEFMDYAKMDPMERMRANILKSMGLTEDDVKNMSPEQQKAVEQKIAQMIRQELQKNAGKAGQVVDVSA